MTRILVIEDNEQNLYLTRFILERGGMEVIEARDGRTGLAAARESAPDLILLDIQLPEMDGFEVARTLRGEERTAGTPIVALTSFIMAEDRARVMDAGCDGMIEKPIEPEHFLDEVRVYLAVD
ncbi:response regulator [bacterium]|nr:response regulator [bacterium]MBU1675215.1 response regulator [bacterium]